MAAVLKAGSVAIDIIANDKDAQATLNQSQKRFDSFGKTVRDVFVTSAAMRATFAGALAPLQQMFSTFSSFEAGMSKVQAISGATADQIKELRELAKLLGKMTFFTASQAADAQQFLAMAGFNPDQIKAALPNVLELALAGDMDLGTAADIATNISTPFKVAARDLGRVNDVLAKAANSSNTNVLEMGQAFKYVAPAASSAGQTIEETAAAMAILANNGIKADMAGTSLRMMMIKLADAGIQKKLFKDFGVEAVDAAGKMRPILSVLQDLKAATSDMTQTEQMSVFYDIFEQRAGTSALVLGNAGEAATDFRLKMINAAGTAAEMSRVMADNIKGDWIAFMSAVEGVQIAVGEALNDSARDFLQLATTVTRSVASFVADNETLIAMLVRVGAGFAILKTGTAVLAALRGSTAALAPVITTQVTAQQANAVATSEATAATTANTAAETASVTAKETQAKASQSVTGSIAATTKAVTSETAALSANTAATAANAKAKSASLLEAVRSGKIYGTTAEAVQAAQKASNDQLKQEIIRRRAAAEIAKKSEENLAAIYKQSASARMATAGATTKLAGASAEAARAARIEQTRQAVLADIYRRETAARMTTVQATATLNSTRLTGAATTWRMTQAEVALVTAQSNATIAARTQAAATAVCTTATNLATRAMTALKASFMAHPAMWITAAVAALGTLVYQLTVAREKAAELHDEMNKQRESGDATRATDDRKMVRLQQLAAQQKLSNEEMREAESLTADLESRYGDFGVSIDSVGNSLTLAADSMKQFMDAMNAKALMELQAELKEGEKNVQELKRQADETSWYWRSVFANVTFGSVDTGEDQIEKIGQQQLDQMKKNAEIREKIAAIQGGSSATDVAKGSEAILEENIAKGSNATAVDDQALKEYERTLKSVQDIQRQMDRERRTSLENEIHDLQVRNAQYKEGLKDLIRLEKAKPEDQRSLENIGEWERQLGEADQGLDESISKILDKHKIEQSDLEESVAREFLTEAMDARDAAVLSGDLEAIKKAQEAFEQAKRDFELTSFNSVKESLAEATAEYEAALEEYNNAAEGSVEKAQAADKVNELQKKVDELNSRRQEMSDTRYNNALRDILDKTKQKSFGTSGTAGTFSAMEAISGLNMTNYDAEMLEQLKLANAHNQKMYALEQSRNKNNGAKLA